MLALEQNGDDFSYLVNFHEDEEIKPREVNLVTFAHNSSNLFNDFIAANFFVVSNVHPNCKLRDPLIRCRRVSFIRKCTICSGLP